MKTKLTLFLAICFILSGKVLAFNCNNASTKIEQMVCANPDLLKTEKELNSIYNDLSRYLSGVERIHNIDNQKEWLVLRRDKCGIDTKCFSDVTRKRITFLKNVIKANEEDVEKINIPEDWKPTGTWCDAQRECMYQIANIKELNNDEFEINLQYFSENCVDGMVESVNVHKVSPRLWRSHGRLSRDDLVELSFNITKDGSIVMMASVGAQCAELVLGVTFFKKTEIDN